MKVQELIQPLRVEDLTADDLRWLIPKRKDAWYPGAEAALERIKKGELFPMRLVGPATGLLLLEKELPFLNVYWVAGRGVMRHMPLYMKAVRQWVPAGMRLKGYVPSEALAASYIRGGATILRYELEF